MNNIFELVTTLSVTDSKATDTGARIAIESGLAGAKDIYLAWGKENKHALKALNETWREVEESIKPAKRAGANGFAAEYYDWLATASRSEQEARDLIMGSESQNVRNHLTHYLNIWALCETVRRGEKVMRTIGAEKDSAGDEPVAKAAKPAKKEPEWSYDQAHPFADERSAAETLLRQKNLVAKKRDLGLLVLGTQFESPSQEGFEVILRNTKKSLKIED